MEAVVALGLASNVVSFLDVASKFCATVSQLYRDGRTSQDAECAIITVDLVKVCADLTAGVIARSGTAGTSTAIDQVCDQLVISCPSAHSDRLNSASIFSQQDARVSRKPCLQNSKLLRLLRAQVVGLRSQRH